ncbi:head GIN domain-containing protein [Mangrovibacterium sp.]|uniref:head GIN domain-containing protein n=1 Tax=Mangrovibacterium sp. TaxID=1961364 RepID=UPI00356892A9
MKSKLFRCIVLAAGFAFISLGSLAESQNQQKRIVSSFSQISVSGGIDLYLTQGAQEQVMVEADDDLIDKIITKVEGETLHIYIEKHTGWVWDWFQSRKVYVTFDDLTRLEASAGADVAANGAVNAETIRISASSGSDVAFERLFAQSVQLSTSSGADAKIAGETRNLSADASSGSDLDCGDLIAQFVRAATSSGADVVVYAIESLTANASSGGDVLYKGNPKLKDIDESSGGEVEPY